MGELSRKERDDNRPLFEAKKGAKLIDDLKRLEKSFPEAVAKILVEKLSARRNSLNDAFGLKIPALAYDPKLSDTPAGSEDWSVEAFHAARS